MFGLNLNQQHDSDIYIKVMGSKSLPLCMVCVCGVCACMCVVCVFGEVQEGVGIIPCCFSISSHVSLTSMGLAINLQSYGVQIVHQLSQCHKSQKGEMRKYAA